MQTKDIIICFKIFNIFLLNQITVYTCFFFIKKKFYSISLAFDIKEFFNLFFKKKKHFVIIYIQYNCHL